MNVKDIKIISGKKMLLEVDTNGHTALSWAEENKNAVENFLTTNGALLIRGLNISDSIEFGQVLKSLFDEDLINYTYRSTPRKGFNNNVYTATEYPASEVIPQHNENAYSNTWPMRIGFVCLVPAAKMGNTPISDSRVVYNEIPKEIREEFERKKIMYVRNYSDIDLPWQEVFQTDSKAVVEQFCKNNRIEYKWTSNGLRTKQVNQSTILHPVTNEKLWFNQAHLFHMSSLDKELQDGLIELLGEENLPRNTFFGDGTPIDGQDLSVIRDVYEKIKFTFDWKKQDLLLLDNMLYGHGREPYEGARQVLVGMAKKYSHAFE